LLVATPRKPGQGEKEIYQAQVKKRMADFNGDLRQAGIVAFKQPSP
jgi:hypothetical protein